LKGAIAPKVVQMAHPAQGGRPQLKLVLGGGRFKAQKAVKFVSQCGECVRDCRPNPLLVGFLAKDLAMERTVCDNYVMRSTRDVVDAGSDPGTGYYSDPPLLVLASLANGPKHGHAMIDDIAQMSGTRLGPGTLYGAIARLEQQGWIEPLPPEERRRPYRITAEGLRNLRAKLTTLHQFSTAALRRLEAR